MTTTSTTLASRWPLGPRVPAGSPRSCLAVVLVAGVARPARAARRPRASGSARAARRRRLAHAHARGPTFVRPTPSPAPTFLSLRRQGRRHASTPSPPSSARPARSDRLVEPRRLSRRLDPESPTTTRTLQVGWVLVVLPDGVVDDNNPPTGPEPPAPPDARRRRPADPAPPTPAPPAAGPARSSRTARGPSATSP